jgi:hypothetical protein
MLRSSAGVLAIGPCALGTASCNILDIRLTDQSHYQVRACVVEMKSPYGRRGPQYEVPL